MQSTNKWKEELEKMECVFTNCDLWDMADRGGDSLPILYRDEVETFIQSLLDTRTRECAEIAINQKTKEGYYQAPCRIHEECKTTYHLACEDIADEIKKLIK